ncbi:flagellar filament capping protein FliD [Pseudoduganella sp. RAF53_2]|uniref:flagellar filament capping protein FliD n=1 Tax=unclassified Pseudoduganella TaxID=2637179 RepID=UPI003F947B9B
MASITAPTYDPKTTATQMATQFMQGLDDMWNDQNTAATNTASGLTTLGSSLSSFQSVLSSMGTKKSVLANSATFSSNVGTATASASATSGNYQFYVEQIGTAGQVSYSGVQDNTVAASAGNLAVTLADGTSFTVNLANADKNLDGTLTTKEIAAAINVDANNNSRVTASTMTINGASTLVLTSNLTGANNDVSLDVSGVTDAGLAAQLGAGNQKRLVTAQDAIIWVGAQGSGTKVQQASNTFTVVDGVSMTFTQAQAAGANPVTLTVANDASGTATNIQAFVDGWNKMLATLKTLTDHGDAASNKAPAIFASDTGLTALQTNMISLLRTSSGGMSLANYGITLQRDGTLSLDSSRLTKALATNPSGLDSIFGSTTIGNETGVLGGMDKLMDFWTNSATGQIATRKDSNSKLQTQLTARKALLDTQYDNAYNRYLAQFTQLQTLQSQMNTTGGIFDAMFGNKSDS